MRTPLVTAKERSGAKYSLSSPPTKRDQGNKRRGPFFHEEIRVFTTWNSKLSFVSPIGTSSGPKRKTPPEHRLGRGSEIEQGMIDQTVPPSRESTRATPHSAMPGRAIISALKMRPPLFIVFLAYPPAPIASEGRGV
jgi:hypothetical protein